MIRLTREVICQISKHLQLPDMIRFYNSCRRFQKLWPPDIRENFEKLIIHMKNFQESQQKKYCNKQTGIKWIRVSDEIDGDISYELEIAYKEQLYYGFISLCVNKYTYSFNKKVTRDFIDYAVDNMQKLSNFNDIGKSSYPLYSKTESAVCHIHHIIEKLFKSYISFIGGLYPVSILIAINDQETHLEHLDKKYAKTIEMFKNILKWRSTYYKPD